MAGMTERQFARHTGRALSTVQEARRGGRLSRSVTKDGRGRIRIDPVLAAEEWRDNTRPSGGNGGAVSPWQLAHARKEAALAARVERENRVAEGKFVKVEQVERRWTTIITGCKTKLLGIPARARQEDPDLTAAQLGLLERLIREALTELATEGGGGGHH